MPSRDAGRELLGAGQVGAEDRLGLVADVAVEALDPVVLRRPGAHAERVPALPPPRLVVASAGCGRSSQVRQDSAWPGSRLTIGPAPQTGTLGLVDPHPQQAGLVELDRLGSSSATRRTGYSRAVSASARAKSSPAVCLAATTSVYRSGVSRRSISDRLRT